MLRRCHKTPTSNRRLFIAPSTLKGLPPNSPLAVNILIIIVTTNRPAIPDSSLLLNLQRRPGTARRRDIPTGPSQAPGYRAQVGSRSGTGKVVELDVFSWFQEMGLRAMILLGVYWRRHPCCM